MTEQMGTPGSTADTSVNGGKVGAPKDRACPFCHQQFTSSSLGRHLDLYIKEKNPKPADGIHDVEEIRKMRGGITRRQPRNSAARREASTPAGTPGAQERRSLPPESDMRGNRSPILRGEGGAQEMSKYIGKPKLVINRPSWETTGVMNHIPVTGNGDAVRSWDGDDRDGRRIENRNRSVSKHVLAKTAFEQKEKMMEALDNAKAAELALRELLGSVRAAKQRIEGPTIFDYDPLALDFPSLTLKCLLPPPTLHQANPFPTSTSWSISPPDEQQYQALRSHFASEFHRWRISCAIATTAPRDDLSYPPQLFAHHEDPAEVAQRAEAEAAELESKVSEHLHRVFTHWTSLPHQTRVELWTLELARNVGRKSEDIEKLKKEKEYAQQEAAHLKIQVDELSRLQHPREFRLAPPVTIPIDGQLINALGEIGVNHEGVGWSIMNRNLHLDTAVQSAIARWKGVVREARGGGSGTTGGMSGQLSLGDKSSSSHTPVTPKQPNMGQNRNHSGTNQRNVQMANGTDTMGSDQDADADADMEEDDSFVEMSDASGQRSLEAPMSQGTNFRLANGSGNSATHQQPQGGNSGHGPVLEGMENQTCVGGYVRIGA